MGLTDEDKSLLREALRKGYVGGTSGALAMTFQVGEFLYLTRKYPLRRYFLGILVPTIAWVKAGVRF